MGGQPSKTSSPAWEKKAVEEALRDMDRTYDEKKGGRPVEDRKAEKLPLDVVATRPEQILKDPKNRRVKEGSFSQPLSSTNPQQVLSSPAARVADQQVFNIRIPSEGAPITNQRSSGRCWLFASTNVFRIAIMAKYQLDKFELSQAYLFYWDKLEKANWFLEQALATTDEPLDGRLMQTLLGDPISDGGQWDMVHNLVDKYGLVPQSLYPDSWNAQSSGTLNAVLKNKLRESTLRLRRMARVEGASADELSAEKDRMVAEVQQSLTLLLGPPPSPTEAFRWQYQDRHGRGHELRMRPREFARDLGGGGGEVRISSSTIDSMISLVDDPRHEPLTLLTVSRLGNVVGGRPVRYINVPMSTMKSACVQMLRAGLPVFFGCDVGKFGDRAAGILDTGLVDYALGGLASDGLLGMSKAQRLRTGESQMTHAMVLTAVHVDDDTGRPTRWRVQNSWGKDSGSEGWYVMSDEWMDAFVFQAVVDLRFCSGEVRKVLDKEPVVLPPWDPMGSLA
ncbi:hypothetical protein CDD80_480 [Ophiocordyceps camponoti-rufipedis]|uniref:Cysteine proteinase 1, mitochondrial n=1 Tax=Ophiocordyceps camponoti-rufipedis TaxID=2004952 RepID=A0A2C5YLF3_9HYPO|nr:hypothetical protein CDD80_480 [Ophiocordyceps camponoti-rufipedis]